MARWRHKTDIYSGAPYCSPLDVLLVILRAVGEFNLIVFGCFGSNHLLGRFGASNHLFVRFGVINHLFVRLGVGLWDFGKSNLLQRGGDGIARLFPENADLFAVFWGLACSGKCLLWLRGRAFISVALVDLN